MQATRWRKGLVILIGLMLLSMAQWSEPTSAQANIPAPVSALKPGLTDNYPTQQIQFILKGVSYSIVVDGDYGPQTTRIVKLWQKANGLAQTGVVDAKTWVSLMAVAPAAPPARGKHARSTPAVTASIAPVDDSAVADAPAEPTQPRHADPGDTEGIIREVWPDDLEDWAVRIAKRESGPNLKVDAANYCCYGIFQIYFTAHRAWLADYGVTQPSDLFDPRTNAIVALALYEQAGPGPWAL